MKYVSRSFAVPLFVCALSAALTGCARKQETEQPVAPAITLTPTGVLSVSPAATPVPTGTGSSSEYTEVTVSPAPTGQETPTPVAVNTDTSTVTYLVNREYPLPEGFTPEGLTTPDVLFPFSDTSIDKAKMTPEAGEALALLFDAAY
ncbi:MAG: hypothetical protein ACI4QX_00025, partial [Lachnospiraceae bacterium]